MTDKVGINSHFSTWREVICGVQKGQYKDYVVFAFGIEERVNPEETCGLLRPAVSWEAGGISLPSLVATDRRQNSGISHVVLSSKNLRRYHEK